ncbi:MAG: hypothetical protein V3T72_06480 [Thermoanaerobaculia bacterium]
MEHLIDRREARRGASTLGGSTPKTFLDRIKSALFVVTKSRRWAPSTAASLADFLRPVLAEGEELPDLELLQELFARALELRQRRLEEADDDHRRVSYERRQLLRARAAAAKKFIRRIVDLRTMLRGFAGAEAAGRFLNLKGETSRDPVVLLRQAGFALAGLRDRSRSIRLASYQLFDRKGWAAAIDGAAKTLKSVVAEVTLKHNQPTSSAPLAPPPDKTTALTVGLGEVMLRPCSRSKSRRSPIRSTAHPKRVQSRPRAPSCHEISKTIGSPSSHRYHRGRGQFPDRGR